MTEQTQIKIEQYLLSLLLKNKKLIYKIPNCFVSDTAKDIYKAIKSTAERDMELTIPNVVLEASKFDPSLNEEKLSILSQVEASEEDINAYMSDLKKIKVIEEIRTDYGKEILSTLEEKGLPDLDKLYELLRSSSKKIMELQDGSSEMLNMKEAIEEFEEELHNRYLGVGLASTGDHRVDELLNGGFYFGEFTLIFGRTSMGKTAFAGHLFQGDVNSNTAAIYVNLEMSNNAFVQRQIAKATGVSYQFFSNLYKDKDRYEQQLGIIDKLKKTFYLNSQIRIIEDPTVNIERLYDYTFELKKELGINRLKIYIDLLSMMHDFNGDVGAQAASIERGVNELSRFAKITNSAVIGVIQSNRKTEGDNKITEEKQIERLRPHLTNLKGSGAWEERARIVLGLFRPKYYYEKYFPELADVQPNTIEVQVLKNTHGPTGGILKYLFVPEKFDFLPWKDLD